MKAGNHVRSLPGFREPQGIAILPDANLLAVANGEGDGLELLNAGDYRRSRMIESAMIRTTCGMTRPPSAVYVGFGAAPSPP